MSKSPTLHDWSATRSGNSITVKGLLNDTSTRLKVSNVRTITGTPAGAVAICADGTTYQLRTEV